MVFARSIVPLLFVFPILAIPAAMADEIPSADMAKPVHVPSETKDTTAWIAEFLDYMGSDPVEQSKHAHHIHDLALEKGNEELALQCQNAIRDWRKAVVLYQMAEYEAIRKGPKEDVVRLTFEKAETAPFRGDNDAQTGSILEAKTAALAAMGRLEEARELLPKIAESARRATALANLLRHADARQAELLLREIDESEFPASKRIGWKLAADRFAKSGEKERALELLRKILASAETHNNATTIEEVESIVLPLLELGDAESAKRAAALCVAFSERTAPEAGWKVRDMVLAARAMRAIGEVDRASEILSVVPAATGKTELFQFARMGGWAATGFLVAGEEEKFNLALRDVVAIGRQHIHHRVRAMAALQVLAILVETGRPLSPDVASELAKSAESIKADPHRSGSARM